MTDKEFAEKASMLLREIVGLDEAERSLQHATMCVESGRARVARLQSELREAVSGNTTEPRRRVFVEDRKVLIVEYANGERKLTIEKAIAP